MCVCVCVYVCVCKNMKKQEMQTTILLIAELFTNVKRFGF